VVVGADGHDREVVAALVRTGPGDREGGAGGDLVGAWIEAVTAVEVKGSLRPTTWVPPSGRLRW
jgi:hypothetical protein